MKRLTYLLICFMLTLSQAQVLDLELFATGLVRPVNIKHANDSRLFVVEQEGTITVVDSDGTLQIQPFLDISSRVYNIGPIGDERGLLGLAFHPNYTTNGYFYVNYIDNSGNTVISRFTRDVVDPTIADPNSELIILTISQPFSNHNGGDMHFGPDDYLYIATGDGGSGGDPQDNGQDTNNLLGKILRIDIDNTANGNNYAIPNDNPFVGMVNMREEIWVYGLRNPWKFSFDRLNNDLWIGDVGQNDIEEIDLLPAGTSGQNLGWRCYEGNAVYNNTGCPPVNELTFPIAEYLHFGSGEFKCSITGGYRYRGTSYSSFEGLYFFADYCSQEIGYLSFNGSTWDMTLTDFSGGNWTAFGEDTNGELYVAGINTGHIYKLFDPSLSTNDEFMSNLNVYPVPAKSELTIDYSLYSPLKIEYLTLYDVSGKIVTKTAVTNEQIQKLDVSSLAKGYYFLKFKSRSAETLVKKIVIN
ncbi:MAG: T9SS type A sorting domain-containing protein [Winogradskyella sp.]|nr:T9SS type A sorting domain-containing protein [Winogradskyella sp.]